MIKSIFKLLIICAVLVSPVQANFTDLLNENMSILDTTDGMILNSIDIRSETSRVIYNGDGVSRRSWALGSGDVVPRDGGKRGHIVHLNTPDDNPFTISKIGIVALRYGTNGYTRFEIWDDGYIIYSNIIRHSEYSSLNWSGWTYIDIPNVIVHDDFYINMCTGSSRTDGVYITLDGDTGTCGSYRSDGRELYWDLDDHARCDVNWMICAVEASDEPNYNDGYSDGMADAILNEVIGDVTGDGKVNICDAVLLFNWVSFPNEQGTTYILR